jgi:hypothetical protein
MADAPTSGTTVAATMTGPPLTILLLGFASVIASFGLLSVGGTNAHIIGYLVGSVTPLLLIGFFRRTDLARRRNPYYVPSRFVRPGLILLAISTMILAGAHVWPIATDVAS